MLSILSLFFVQNPPTSRGLERPSRGSLKGMATRRFTKVDEEGEALKLAESAQLLIPSRVLRKLFP